MKNRSSTSIQIISVLAITAMLALGAGPLPIHNGQLTDPLNAGQQPITNAAGIWTGSDTNASPMYDTNGAASAAQSNAEEASLPLHATADASTQALHATNADAVPISGITNMSPSVQTAAQSATDSAPGALATKAGAAADAPVQSVVSSNAGITVSSSTGTYTITLNADASVITAMAIQTNTAGGFPTLDSNGFLSGPQYLETMSSSTSPLLGSVIGETTYYQLGIDTATGALYHGNGSANTLVGSESFLPLTYLSTDGTFAANSDSVIASQKATKTYVTSAISSAASSYMPLSYLDTSGTLSANSDTKVASQKAVKTYVAAQIATVSGGGSGPTYTYDPVEGGDLALSGSNNFVFVDASFSGGSEGDAAGDPGIVDGSVTLPATGGTKIAVIQDAGNVYQASNNGGDTSGGCGFSTFNLTVNAAGSDTILSVSGGTGSSVTLSTDNETAYFYSLGSGSWVLIEK